MGYYDEYADEAWMNVLNNGKGHVDLDGYFSEVTLVHREPRPRDSWGEAMEGEQGGFIVVKDDRGQHWKKETYESSYSDEVLIEDWHRLTRVDRVEKVVIEWKDV